MILEGLVTTRSPDGGPHLAPMGPRVEPGWRRFLLRPFPTSQTYQNLLKHGEGVLHVTDDVLLLARAALGKAPMPAWVPATKVQGYVLESACRFYEFTVLSIDTSSQRVSIEAEVVHAGVLREFFGFNRAKHAVLEAAILATRFGLLNLDEVAAEFRKLRVIVDKTGGPAEAEAFDFLQGELERARSSPHPPAPSPTKG
jgi:uncharacterized protein